MTSWHCIGCGASVTIADFGQKCAECGAYAMATNAHLTIEAMQPAITTKQIARAFDVPEVMLTR